MERLVRRRPCREQIEITLVERRNQAEIGIGGATFELQSEAKYPRLILERRRSEALGVIGLSLGLDSLAAEPLNGRNEIVPVLLVVPLEGNCNLQNIGRQQLAFGANLIGSNALILKRESSIEKLDVLTHIRSGRNTTEIGRASCRERV